MPLELEEQDEQDLQDFNEKIESNRHRETMAILGTIAQELQKEKGDDGVKSAIDKHFKSIEKLVNSIANIPKTEIPAPIVNVSSNNDGIVESFQHIANQISSEIASLKVHLAPKPVEWEWTIIRNRSGLIENINAKAK